MKHYTKLIGLLFLGAIVILTPFLGTSAYAKAGDNEKIELVFGATWPPDNIWSKGDILWIEKIEKETNGRVKIKVSWAGALISMKNGVDELKAGICDIASIIPQYDPNNFPLLNAFFSAYYGLSDYETIFAVERAVAAKFPEIDAEYNGMKILKRSIVPAYHLFSNKPVASLSDFKGITIKALSTLIPALKELGCNGINMPASDMYTSLEKNVIDGVMLPFSAMRDFKINEVTKYITLTNSAIGPSGDRVMNIKTWNSLPPDIQKVFDDNIEWYSKTTTKLQFESDAKVRETAEEKGMKIYSLSKEEQANFYKLIDASFIEKAKKLDEKGLPGTPIFMELRKQVQRYSGS